MRVLIDRISRIDKREVIRCRESCLEREREHANKVGNNLQLRVTIGQIADESSKSMG